LRARACVHKYVYKYHAVLVACLLPKRALRRPAARVWLLGHMVNVEFSTSLLGMTMAVGMVTSWLFGGLFPSEFASKWLMWLCGFWFYLVLMFVLMKPFRAAAAKRLVLSGKRRKGIISAGARVCARARACARLCVCA
jgi:hypothetical protein